MITYWKRSSFLSIKFDSCQIDTEAKLRVKKKMQSLIFVEKTNKPFSSITVEILSLF